MSNLLASVRAKLAWADNHIHQLQQSISAFFASDPYTIALYVNRDSKECAFKLRNVKPIPSIEWGLLIGAAAHEMRSALDHLMWQLVKLDGNVPRRRQTLFPIFESVSTRRERQRFQGRTQGLTKHRTIVEQLQPYQRRHDAKTHPLWLLSELDNMSKHRVLPVVLLGATSSGLGLGPMIPATLAVIQSGGLQRIEEGAVIAQFILDPLDALPYMNMNPQVIPQIRFDQIPDPEARIPEVEGLVVMETLRLIREYVHNDVFAKLEPDFP